MAQATIQMTPGDDTHLTLLMAPQSLNFCTGQDREHLLAYGRAAFAAGQASKCLLQIAEPAAVHPDDVAVDALAALMKAKLAKQRAKGYGGWNDKAQCSQQRLSDMLRGHVDKGDPVDVANFCAFLLARGEGIAAAPQAVQPAIMPKGESAAAQLRAMATNYPAGHSWDKLDARACIRGALEIEALRALLAAAPAHPAEGVPTSSDLRERLARLEAGCNAHTTPTVYEAIADSKAALDELDEARQRVGISLAATQPAAQAVPVLYVSKGQLDNHRDPDGVDTDGAGRYLPARKTPKGNFTAPLYERPAPAAQGLDAPNEWEGIHTMPTCDDLIWLYCQDTNTIDGPIAPDPSLEQYGWTHWAYANAPSTAGIDAAQAKQGGA